MYRKKIDAWGPAWMKNFTDDEVCSVLSSQRCGRDERTASYSTAEIEAVHPTEQKDLRNFCFLPTPPH